ncbi:MAG: 2-C-methyl-D-erythritol 4-phosphate cytidylyltransferase [Ruminococcus sp.]|jgi:2-C-methyl-D-erythritol 4-phosphate cytidylyltransferase|nr:2-C-methyl-D-erythritol 4-phosphate cytidylyltransferase [Ruminococcus sp.]
MNFGVLLAGGRGERIKSIGVPKQFAEVGGKPLFAYALEALGKCAAIDVICVVTFSERQEEIKKHAEEFTQKIIFAEPGKSRQHSVLSGLEAIEREFAINQNDNVVVHDAARPLATETDIENCIFACKDFDGATPAIPPSDTIYMSDNGVTIGQILIRDKLFAGQTPECYNLVKYLAAFRRLSDGEIEKIRGGSELAFLSGMNIHLYPGNPLNIKITTDFDLKLLQFLIEEREKT